MIETGGVFQEEGFLTKEQSTRSMGLLKLEKDRSFYLRLAG
jgi:hypothetical protein